MSQRFTGGLVPAQGPGIGARRGGRGGAEPPPPLRILMGTLRALGPKGPNMPLRSLALQTKQQQMLPLLMSSLPNTVSKDQVAIVSELRGR